MVMSGADVDALDLVGVKLEGASDALRRKADRLSADLHAAPWSGINAEMFRQRFDSEHYRAIYQAAKFLDDAYETMRRNADEQRVASGLGPASIGHELQVAVGRLPHEIHDAIDAVWRWLFPPNYLRPHEHQIPRWIPDWPLRPRWPHSWKRPCIPSPVQPWFIGMAVGGGIAGLLPTLIPGARTPQLQGPRTLPQPIAPNQPAPPAERMPQPIAPNQPVPRAERMPEPIPAPAQHEAGPANPPAAGQPPAGARSYSFNPFAKNFSDQCTYYAEERMHSQTGRFMQVTGNAYQWADQARGAGWTVGSAARVNSVVVFPKGAFGSSVGHVGWVAAVAGNRVRIQDYNWNWSGAHVSDHWVTIPSGTQFIYSDR